MRRALIIAGSVLAVAAGSANAQTALASFTYDSLAGDFTPTGLNGFGLPVGVFSANAVNQPGLRTVGSFNRTVATSGTASFPAGFVTDPNAADITITMNVSVNPGSTADGLGGILRITDVDGDYYEAQVLGTWYSLNPFYFFNGDLRNVAFFDVGPQDGVFNGYAGSWNANLPGNPLEGTIVNLVFNSGTPGFFTQGFNDFAVGVSGQIVPTPASIALLAAGGLLATRRRRA